MSGPKVVRIVSLEEKQLFVSKHQKKMLFALKQFRQLAQANQQLLSSLSETLDERQKQFNALDENDYETIETFASEQLGFLNAEQETLENKLIEQKRQRKHRIRQIKLAATGLQKALLQREQVVPAVLIELTHLSLNTKLDQLEQHEKVLQNAVNSLMTKQAAESRSAPLSDELIALQARLKTDDQVRPLESWISKQTPIVTKQQQRLDSLLSHLELMSLSNNTAVQLFIERAEALEYAIPSSKTTLQLDSLLLDVSQFVQQQKGVQEIKHALQLDLQIIQEALSTSDADKVDIVALIQSALASANITQELLEKTLTQAQEFIETQETLIASQTRRQAVLHGLSELGYQVTENMSTAWVENGRLVVRKADETQYGIELTTNADMQRLQARVVVSSDMSQRDRGSDIQAEEVWCGDFSSLKAMIQAQNGELIIDKMLPIGSQKLKEVSMEAKADEERARQYRQQQSKLRSRSR